MRERYKIIPAAFLLLEKEDKVLLGLRQNTGYEDGNWYAPAGHVEDSELPSEAMIREAKEELDITLAPDELACVHTMFRSAFDETAAYVYFYFRAATWKGEVANAEPDKCGELRWISRDELPENTTTHVRHALECIGRGEVYSELNSGFFTNA